MSAESVIDLVSMQFAIIALMHYIYERKVVGARVLTSW
jgi:hypothetical protein